MGIKVLQCKVLKHQKLYERKVHYASQIRLIVSKAQKEPPSNSSPFKSCMVLSSGAGETRRPSVPKPREQTEMREVPALPGRRGQGKSISGINKVGNFPNTAPRALLQDVSVVERMTCIRHAHPRKCITQETPYTPQSHPLCSSRTQKPSIELKHAVSPLHRSEPSHPRDSLSMRSFSMRSFSAVSFHSLPRVARV